jgi:hypothetical protein
MSEQQSTFKEPETPVIQNTESIQSGTATDENSTFNPPPTTNVQAEQQQQVPVVQEQSKFVKDVKEIIVNISQEHYNKIIEGLKKDTLRFEYVSNAGEIKVDTKPYIPMTIGQNKKVGKVVKKERLVREDIRAFIAGEEGALNAEEIKKKYDDIFDSDVDEDDLRNATTVAEILGNYSVAKKASIYWGIENIENYTLNDIVMIIALYESRNGYNPSS